MKIAFLTVSLSLMVAISAYDWRNRRRDIFAEFEELAAGGVRCLLVQTAVFKSRVLDKATLLNIKNTPNDRCIVKVSIAVAANSTTIKTVSDEAITEMLKKLEKLKKTYGLQTNDA